MTLDHGLVSSGKVLALVAPDSSVDWLCLPRFDAPSVFARILDPEGGTFRVEGAPISMRYRADTNVLETVLAVDGGTVRIIDACRGAAFVRAVEPVSGTPSARVVFEPRPDYARCKPALRLGKRGIDADGLTLATSVGAAILAGEPVDFSQAQSFVLAADPPALDAFGLIHQATEEDRRYCADMPPALRRHALVLKAHTYQQTGAIIAAATTSIPEAIGTPRTWDYRYAWIRDGSFAAEALLRLGKPRAAWDFLDFMRNAIANDAPQPLYGIEYERDLTERSLPHLRGFADTQPVRIGNAAALQIQHDAYGQIVWLADAWEQAVDGRLDATRYAWVERQAEAALAVGDAPDCGIWEFRDRPGRYTFSQLWRWVAFDRMARIAARHAQPDERWRSAAETVRADLLAAADRVGFFAQTLDGDDVDASSLQIAALGLVPGDDPRLLATIDRCEAVLAIDGLMRRYVAEDDFGETTSTFGLCTLWWAEALALAGRVEAAQAVYERFSSFANPVGLFAEDIEPDTGRLLGNFPQVYSHTGLITARLALDMDLHEVAPKSA